MITNIVVEVEERSERGKNAARRARAAGKVPGTLYGMKSDAFALTVNPRRLEEILKLESGRNTIFQLALAGGEQSRAAMIRDLQRDPVSDRVIHVDFVRVDLEKTVKVAVPIRLVGIPVGVKLDGGVLEFVTRQIEVECLPAAIPEHIDLDVSELHINQHASVKDLPHPEGVKTLTDPEAIVVVVAAVKAEEAPAAEAAAATPAEPEVIKKGKETAEGAAPEKEKK
jgi:large subunit ribosomal protein L25